MSKDIWHFPSEAPAYCFLCVFEDSFDGEVHCGHYNPVKKQFCSTEGRYEIKQVKKYCDLLHLLDCEQELIRTRKALDIAKDALKRIDETRSGVKENLHATNGRVLNAGNGFCWATIDDIHNALYKITALKQKEVK